MYSYFRVLPSSDGMVGIVASALTGSIWNGSCWVFGGYDDLKDIAQETYPILSTSLPSGPYVANTYNLPCCSYGTVLAFLLFVLYNHYTVLVHWNLSIKDTIGPYF